MILKTLLSSYFIYAIAIIESYYMQNSKIGLMENKKINKK